MLRADLRLLVFNLATDESDPLLAFTARWVTALAERTASVHVITMREGPHELPANVSVRSIGKEKGYSEPKRVLEFYRHLRAVLHEGVDVCFSHMAPLFTILGGPLLKLHGVPIVTWYAHPRLSNQLRLAHWLSDRMVASVESAYPYHKDKLVVTGQGVDTQRFTPAWPPTDDPPLILYVGRLSPAKDVATLVRAIGIMANGSERQFKVGIVGGPAVPADESYVAELHSEVVRLGLEETIWFHPLVPFQELPDWYRRASIFVNLSPMGFGDKVAWEAMACGVPCVLANEGFRDTLGQFGDDLLFRYGDPEQLAQRLSWLLSLPADRRRALGDYLRSQVVALHDFRQLGDRLVGVLLDVRNNRAPKMLGGVGSEERR